MSENSQNKAATEVEKKSSNRHVIPFAGGLVGLCFIAGVLGAWVSLDSGLVKNSATITKNQEKVVSSDDQIMESLAKKVAPSVVSVTTQSVDPTSFTNAVSEGAGTGMIISSNGYILTNKHVISGAQTITVVDNNGMTYNNVQLVGTDPLNDIAFLKIPGNANNFPAVTLGDSSAIQVGQRVVAIGNALGQYQNSVTSGIISGRGRPLVAQDGTSDEQLDNLFQTDAAINPGNSGGPLLNLSGEVIGIDTAIAENAQGIGFAIPINATKGLVKTVLQSGAVKRAYLGVRYINITPEVVQKLKLSVNQGAYVYPDSSGASAVISGSPADKAGIKDKDIIIKVNGQAIDSNNSLDLLLEPFAPGDHVSLTVLSGGSSKTLDVTLATYTAS